MIVIEGVVGSGKTALMEIMIEKGYYPFSNIIEENEILDKFYYNRSKYAFILQVYFLNKRFECIKLAEGMKNVVMDRSIYGDLIFAKILKQNKELTDEEYAVFLELQMNMLQYIKKPKLLIYLDISTEKAIEQISQRGRIYEQEVERDYWSRLNKEYQEYFNNYDLSPILKVNIDNLDFKNNYKDREHIISLIDKKLKEIEEV